MLCFATISQTHITVASYSTSMGMAIDAIGFLLVLGSIPLAFGILRLVSKDESIEFVSFIGERSTLYAFVGLFSCLLYLMVRSLFCQSSWLSHLQVLQGVWIGQNFAIDVSWLDCWCC